MTRRTAALLVMLVAAVAGCDSPSPGLKGPGGISYDWPPPASLLAAPSSAARFCRLLVDDYQHLKTSQQTHGIAAEQRILEDYISFGPTLQAAAPATIGRAVARYIGAVSALLRALLAHGLDVLAVPQRDLAPMSSPQVQAASSVLTTFAQQTCHYDLAANSTPVSPPRGGAHA